ncbi:MAG: TIGR04086 family membrane protein [Clostridia bacterium]|nr:TIGR04086 family membrane protein [Clostridia bacterium]
MMKRSIKARKRAAAQAPAPSPASLARHLLKSCGLTLLFTLLLLTVFSLALYFSPNPTPMIAPMGILAAALTALLGGFAATRVHGHAALICGLLSGSVLTAVMLLLSLFFRSQASNYSAAVSCALHAGVFLLSIAGAYLGLYRSPKKKKRKH